MDSITHVALGAVVGEAVAGKSLGKRALFLGAIAQSIPDIDFIAAFFLAPADNLLAHRGFTHSFLFGALVALTLAALSLRWYKAHQVPFSRWVFFFGLEILIHLALDACNAYGVGWLEPFSHQRFSFHVLFVADPFYSLAPVLAMIMLMSVSARSTARRFWIWFGIVVSTAYLLYAISGKIMVTRQTTATLAQQRVSYKRLLTTPTPFNSWLWYVVAENGSGFYTGYRSVADAWTDPLLLHYFHKNDSLLSEEINERHDVKQLKKFSQGYYTIEQRGDTLLFNDLRFGQIAGWEYPEAPFVFQYYINYPDANLMVIQRGRFSNWNQHTFSSMIERMRGKK
ncbi:metal-dependent hydrolase [Fulvivirgaceae bacterium PWU4]|uniref:Metal-dependent hydrolase n=1 Tax=Chryseosolibacter histidini TaxID=2782349 RepID=A0AAP2GTB5_9BACT|nr:metal-dependent hydrolase [Chryseosolibacter histidini]MBT1701467.1 metal-dependent hydrolase [Chryseosolibacter histidini]